jgi:hypothetical protein
MATFDEREKGFEAKYKVDQELRFKITARRNKLLGMWAAQKLGLAGSDADAYAKEVVAADFSKPGDEDVIAKVVGDFTAKGVAADAGAIKSELEKLSATARDQVIAEQAKS